MLFWGTINSFQSRLYSPAFLEKPWAGTIEERSCCYQKRRDLDVQGWSQCSSSLRKLDLLAAPDRRNLSIAREEHGEGMILPSWEGQGMAVLCQQQQSSLVPQKAGNFSASFYWLRWNYLLPGQGFTCASAGAACELGWVPFLPLSLSGSCFATQSTASGNGEKCNFLFSFFLHFAVGDSCPEFQDCTWN